MTIFNSLGSNYDFGFVIKALFAKNRKSYKEKLINFLEKKYGGRAILVYKGREAIGLALEILKLPKESFVAINGFTCFTVYKAIDNEGYSVELIDIDKDNLNFSAKLLSNTLKQNPKIKVVIIQNTLGYPCDIEEIAKICRKNNLILIEDLAHSVGAKYKNGKEAGTVGDFVVLSFSQDKIIDAISGGALIIRNNFSHSGNQTKPECPESLRTMVDSGQARITSISPKQELIDRPYPLLTFIVRKTYPISLGRLIHFILKAFNLLSKPMNESFYEKYSLPNWYAYLVLDGFNKLSKNLEHRKKIASIYNSILSKKVCSKFIDEGIKLSSNLRFPIFVENRQGLINYLKKERVHVSDIWYDDVDETLPNCQIAANTILNLPTHINASEEDAKNIAQKINQWLKSQ